MKYSIPYYLRLAFVKASLPILAGTGALAPAALYYAVNNETASSQRVEGIGDIQYQALHQQALSIIAKDKTLQTFADNIKQRHQIEAVTRDHAEITAESKTAYEELKEKSAQIGADYKIFTRRLLASEGISEKDAIELNGMISQNTRYSSTTYSFQSNPKTALIWLDECQNNSTLDLNAKIDATAQCLATSRNPINYDLMGLFAAIGGFFGFIGWVGNSRREINMRNKIEDERAEFSRNEYASPKPKEQVRETKIREILKPPR